MNSQNVESERILLGLRRTVVEGDNQRSIRTGHAQIVGGIRPIDSDCLRITRAFKKSG